MGPVLLDPQGEFVTVQLSKQIADRIVAFYVTCYEPESWTWIRGSLSKPFVLRLRVVFAQSLQVKRQLVTVP